MSRSAVRIRAPAPPDLEDIPAGRAGNCWAFSGFEVEVFATGLDLPVNIAMVPEPDNDPDAPLFYVSELYGQVKAITNSGKVSRHTEELLN